jgi:hypothetical protein
LPVQQRPSVEPDLHVLDHRVRLLPVPAEEQLLAQHQPGTGAELDAHRGTVIAAARGDDRLGQPHEGGPGADPHGGGRADCSPCGAVGPRLGPFGWVSRSISGACERRVLTRVRAEPPGRATRYVASAATAGRLPWPSAPTGLGRRPTTQPSQAKDTRPPLSAVQRYRP